MPFRTEGVDGEHLRATGTDVRPVLEVPRVRRDGDEGLREAPVPVSVGELIRSACERQYGLVSEDLRSDAVKGLAAMGLPVADPRTMKRESVPDAGDLLQ